MRRALSAAALLGSFAAACAPASPSSGPEDVSGTYTRGGFHFVLQCANDPIPHIVEYVYPANIDADTWTIDDADGALSVRYGAVQIGSGERHGRHATIHLTAIDDQPGSAVDWVIEGQIENSLPYHPRLFSGHLDPAVLPGVTAGGGGECVFDERSVFWWSEEPDADLGPETIAANDDDAVLGDFTLFAWWAKLGTVSPIPGKGPERATGGGDMISLAISTHTSIARQNGSLVMDDHVVSEPGRGVGDSRGLWYRQVDHTLVDITASEAVLVNAPASNTIPGVKRLFVGWLSGRLYIDPAGYPPGLTGPMGWTDIGRPGIVFWEEVDYGAAGAPSFAPDKSLQLEIGSLSGRRTILDGIPQE